MFIHENALENVACKIVCIMFMFPHVMLQYNGRDRFNSGYVI